MRVVFAGTPPFAARALEAIASAGHAIPLVLTQPDRPARRGLKLSASAVAGAADALRLRVEKPASMRTPEGQELIRAAHPDVMVVAAYGLILPPSVLGTPRHGCINIHASLLPRWRGAAPIQRAILAGDAQTGVTIMQMDAGLDTGPMLLERTHPIGARDTTGSLTDALAVLGAMAVCEVLERDAPWTATPQDDSRSSYAPKIAKSEARIDWASPNTQLDRQVRAFNPAPGAEAILGEEMVKVWEAVPATGSGPAGQVLKADESGIVVACGEGALRILVLQRPGARRLSSGQFLQKKPLTGSPGIPATS